jgi:hypothetical protein
MFFYAHVPKVFKEEDLTRDLLNQITNYLNKLLI